MNHSDSFTANISQPFEVTARTINTRNDTQTEFSVNNSNSILSNTNNSTILNSVQNQPQIPVTNP